LLGQLGRILDISDSDAGVKEEKLEGSVGGEGECGDEVEVLLKDYCFAVIGRRGIPQFFATAAKNRSRRQSSAPRSRDTGQLNCQ